MPKRNFPFESYSPQPLKNHIGIAQIDREQHMRQVYARTHDMLVKGAVKCKSWNGDIPAQAIQLQIQGACAICRRAQQKVVMAACSFCDKEICTSCSRQCLQCGDFFCSFCSTINYDEPEERYFCLSCHQS